MYKDRLKELRDINGIKQKDLALYLDLSISSYATYENEIDILPIKHLIKITEYFNVSMDYLFKFSTEFNYDNSNKDGYHKNANRLKDLRKELGLTQKDLADTLQCDKSTIAKYEKGTNIIATPFLYEICKKYKISADYLLGKVDEPKYLK